MPVITDLFLYPVKSCAGFRVDSADLWETGLFVDRLWMVVDETGQGLSQRTLPRMALIRTAIRFESLQLRAPGMLRLDIPIGGFDYDAAPRRTVRVGDDEVAAFEESELVNTWFSRFLEQPVQLVRIDPDFRRVCDRRYTGDVEAITQFADGFPILVASRPALAGLNERLAAKGAAPVGIERFRPNIVIDDIDAHGEDFLETLTAADYALQLVKPCARCAIVDVDPASAEVGTEPTETLMTYRLDEAAGGITFGVNAIVTRGADEAVVRVGDVLEGGIRFA